MKYSLKTFIICIAGLVVVIGGGMFCYQQIFTKGIDRLPNAVCDNSVQRGTVARLLPKARSAGQDSGVTGAGEHFLFTCRVSTSGKSIASGEVRISDTSVESWMDYYRRGEKVTRVSVGDVQAFATSRLATVYVPCTPEGVKKSSARESYALTADTSVIGKSRAKGAELRQELTDFAYQMTTHAYGLAGCSPAHTLAKELPRYGSR